MEPTEEQIKEFWEWCGIEHKHIKGEGLAHYRDNDWWYGTLAIDLNNLFKYAMTQLKQDQYYKALSSLFYYDAVKEDPALALFWALWEVING